MLIIFNEDKYKEFKKSGKKPSDFWGKDFIMGIVDGIKNAVGFVVDAVKGVADTITSFLHFSVPDEGPLTEYESWMPDSYDVSMSDVEADSGGETEAGTTQRDVIRTGVVEISVSFNVTMKWLKLFTVFRNQPKITVQYFDTETASMKQTEMYMDSFKSKLVKDTSYKGLWNVSFVLKEM